MYSTCIVTCTHVRYAYVCNYEISRNVPCELRAFFAAFFLISILPHWVLFLIKILNDSISVFAFINFCHLFWSCYVTVTAYLNQCIRLKKKVNWFYRRKLLFSNYYFQITCIIHQKTRETHFFKIMVSYMSWILSYI